jgi:hypothetical protein
MTAAVAGLLRYPKKMTVKTPRHAPCLFIRPKMRASRLYGPAPAKTTVINIKA